MDATKKPLLIPPEFSTYAEKHGIYQVYERLLKKLLVQQPEEPLQAIVDWLREPECVPEIVVLGPPGSGKRSISRLAADRLCCVYISKEELGSVSNDQEIATAIKERIYKQDCVERGYLLEGLPENRAQALQLQIDGIFPKHVVLLDAPDTVLTERVIGKRIDTITGDVYHVTFHPPPSDVIKRVKPDPDSCDSRMTERLASHHRNIAGILRCYADSFKRINADQPRDDVLSQSLTYLSTKNRDNAPHTPRVILLGPTGSGKREQASLLCSKYQLVHVCYEDLIKQMLANESNLGQSMKPYADRGVRIPDELVTKALIQRLSRLDAVKRGWVLHGFPKTRTQLDSLTEQGYEPNRVVVLDIPSDTAVERLSLRSVDPQTGYRYHLLYNPPQVAEVKDRLSMHPNDEESQVLKRYSDYQVNVEDILEFFPSAQHVNGDQDRQAVFESIETTIVNPLPDDDDETQH